MDVISSTPLPQAGADFSAHTMSLISTSTSSEEAAASAQLVIEAIVEDIEVKRELFARLDKVAPRWSMCEHEHLHVCVWYGV